MEKSAIEALIIAMNTVIFVVALGVGMTLMRNVNKMVEITREVRDSVISGNLAESYSGITERTITGAQLYSLYRQYNAGEFDGSIYIGTYGPDVEYILECTADNTYTVVPKWG